MELGDRVFETIRLNYDQLFSAEKRIAEYILENPERAIESNVGEIAKLCSTSDATVVRFCKHIGYNGFYHMKLQLAHEVGRKQLISGNKVLKTPATWGDIIEEIATNIVHSRMNVDGEVLGKCVELILNCNTIHLVAAGNSIPSAIDFAFRLGRIGIRTNNSFMPEQQLNNILLGSDQDIVVGISHSGSSKQVLQAFELAKKRKMPIIAITDLKNTPVEKEATYTISSGIEYSSVYMFGAASHIYISSYLDVILYFVMNAKSAKENNKDEEIIEVILSETKV